MWKKAATLFLYAVLLIVTVSSAWILDIQNNSGSFAQLFYGFDQDGTDSGNRLSVSSKDITMEVFFKTAAGRYYSIGNSNEPLRTTPITIDSQRIIPNAQEQFRIAFTNSADTTLRVSVSVIITCDQRLITKQAISLGANGQYYDRYSDTATAPTGVFRALKPAGDYVVDPATGYVTFEFVIFDNLQIPVTNQGPVELLCTLEFDAVRMDNECAGCKFEIISFNAEQQ